MCRQFRQVQALAVVAILTKGINQTFRLQRRPDGRQWLVCGGSAGRHAHENKTGTLGGRVGVRMATPSRCPIVCG